MKRFWDKIEKTEGCWNWIAGSRGNGYGAFKYKGRVYDAHRFSWMLEYKKMPSLWVLHTCDNRKCVNPGHLYEGTFRDNISDMMTRGRHYSVPHGNYTKYNHGCRCEPCRGARTLYQKNRRAKKRTHSSEEERGTFNP